MIRSSGQAGYSALMRSLGVDPLPLLARHGLAPDHGENHDAFVPLRACVELLEDSAAVAHCPDLGLRLAASQDIRILGPLAAAMQHASTVGEALATASRYLFVHSPALVFSVNDNSTLASGAVELRIDITLSHLPEYRQIMDECLGVLHRILQFLGQKNYELLAVALPHAPAADQKCYSTFFNASVYANQDYGALHVTPATLAAGLAEVNGSLRKIALDYLNRHYADPAQSMTFRVRRALTVTLGANRGSKAAIADLLFMHPRTLQRKLTEEGAAFDSIRDEVRQQTALHFLRETRIPLAQLPGILGFADQSVLTRSCQRWFGTTPLRLRSQKKDEQADPG